MLHRLCVFSALLLFGNCASGGRNGSDASTISDGEALQDRQIDTTPDAIGSSSDGAAPKGEPDATVSEPDATVSEPDATVSEPDATVSEPDASAPNPVAPSALVINEIEVNNPGDDYEEFVEVLNRTDASIDLRGVDLVHINGALNNPELGRWALSSATRSNGSVVSALAAGELLVLAQQGSTVLANLPSDTPRVVHTTPLQNGPDVLQIEDGSGTVIDSVAYQDDIAGYGEGSSAQGDLGDDRGLSRCPHGADTNDNSVDFVRAQLTPASPNTCP